MGARSIVGWTPAVNEIPRQVYVCKALENQCNPVLNDAIHPADGTAYKSYRECQDACGSMNELALIRLQ